MIESFADFADDNESMTLNGGSDDSYWGRTLLRNGGDELP